MKEKMRQQRYDNRWT